MAGGAGRGRTGSDRCNSHCRRHCLCHCQDQEQGQGRGQDRVLSERSLSILTELSVMLCCTVLYCAMIYCVVPGIGSSPQMKCRQRHAPWRFGEWDVVGANIWGRWERHMHPPATPTISSLPPFACQLLQIHLCLPRFSPSNCFIRESFQLRPISFPSTHSAHSAPMALSSPPIFRRPRPITFRFHASHSSAVPPTIGAKVRGHWSDGVVAQLAEPARLVLVLASASASAPGR